MGHNNARFYCLEHPTRIGNGYCKECKSSMCSQCLNEHKDFCPACRRELHIGSAKNVSGKTLLIALFGGILGLIITYLVLISKYPEEPIIHLFPQGHLFFFLGISAFYTPYMYRDSDLFEELGEIPFVGFKLRLIVFLIIVASLIPALSYLYKVFLYFNTNKKRNI